MANLAYASKLLGHWNKMHDNNLKMEKRRQVQDASGIPRSQRPALNHATHVYQSRNPFPISSLSSWELSAKAKKAAQSFPIRTGQQHTNANRPIRAQGRMAG
jgi:hypothetical protein